MFYKKECNYAFMSYTDPECTEKSFKAACIMDEKNPDICELFNRSWGNVDTCILWATYILFVESDWKPVWKRIVIQDSESNIELEFQTQDELLEAMWKTLEDVNIDESECIEQNWFIFPVGTFREDIWHWFDERHSKGVYWLMYEVE